ncbi:MAG: dimethyl sulfoxide reductase anchor subunit family protein [Gammaproteobacteria bacterium]
MHPAYSVIFFTVSSGAGFGLLAVIALGSLLGWWQPTDGAAGPGIALLIGAALAIAGLLSSTFHLGHPERAWRALSQWRSSWLSREGVLAIAVFVPVVVMLLAWWKPEDFADLLVPAALATFLLVIATVYCTAMIYASLKTIPRWNQPLVAPVYLLFAIASGALLALLFVTARPVLLAGSISLLVVAWLCKWVYWRTIDNAKPISTAESATGLGALGKVSPLDLPHTSANYIQKEMGFAIARKHAMKLRRIALALGLGLPLLFLFVAWVSQGGLQTAWVLLAAISLIAGLLVERWLFFAEAEHVVTTFYGASSV